MKNSFHTDYKNPGGCYNQCRCGNFKLMPKKKCKECEERDELDNRESMVV